VEDGGRINIPIIFCGVLQPPGDTFHGAASPTVDTKVVLSQTEPTIKPPPVVETPQSPKQDNGVVNDDKGDVNPPPKRSLFHDALPVSLVSRDRGKRSSESISGIPSIEQREKRGSEICVENDFPQFASTENTSRVKEGGRTSTSFVSPTVLQPVEESSRRVAPGANFVLSQTEPIKRPPIVKATRNRKQGGGVNDCKGDVDPPPSRISSRHAPQVSLSVLPTDCGMKGSESISTQPNIEQEEKSEPEIRVGADSKFSSTHGSATSKDGGRNSGVPIIPAIHIEKGSPKPSVTHGSATSSQAKDESWTGVPVISGGMPPPIKPPPVIETPQNDNSGVNGRKSDVNPSRPSLRAPRAAPLVSSKDRRKKGSESILTPSIEQEEKSGPEIHVGADSSKSSSTHGSATSNDRGSNSGVPIFPRRATAPTADSNVVLSQTEPTKLPFVLDTPRNKKQGSSGVKSDIDPFPNQIASHRGPRVSPPVPSINRGNNSTESVSMRISGTERVEDGVPVISAGNDWANSGLTQHSSTSRRIEEAVPTGGVPPTHLHLYRTSAVPSTTALLTSLYQDEVLSSDVGSLVNIGEGDTTSLSATFVTPFNTGGQPLTLPPGMRIGDLEEPEVPYVPRIEIRTKLITEALVKRMVYQYIISHSRT
jgi:hypothetical protein